MADCGCLWGETCLFCSPASRLRAQFYGGGIKPDLSEVLCVDCGQVGLPLHTHTNSHPPVVPS